MSKCIDTFAEKYILNDQTSFLDIMSVIYNMTSLLVQKYSQSINDEKSTNFDRLKPVFDYINKNYNKKIYLSELSDMLHICDDHFVRIFKLVTNKSPIRYINDIKAEKAMQQLIDTNNSISEIAEIVGFSSANYMTRTFKKLINMSPNEYRKFHHKINK